MVSAAFALIDVAALCGLSHYEHTRSVRPSSILSIYLLLSSLFDGVQARTLGLRKAVRAIASIFIICIVLKMGILVIESQSKSTILKQPDTWKAPEATSGIFSRSTFWWLNRLFLIGFRKTLTLNHLFSLETELNSERLNQRCIHAWEQGERKQHLICSTI